MSESAHDVELLSQCCDLFRTGHHAQASVLLDKWLQQWTALAASKPELMDETSCKSLGVALDCQQRHDWIGLADELEFVLARRMKNHTPSAG
jgi:hypothetical protein